MTISIIVPVYNVENYLKQCIDSIIQQTYPDIEVTLINDGSTDSSGMICDLYAEMDNRISVIHQNNRGLAAARDSGITASKGEYLMFVDSDDFLYNQNCLEKVAVQLNKNKPDVLVYGMRKYNDAKDIFYEDNVIYTMQKDNLSELINTNSYKACACDKAVKRNMVEKYGLCFSGITTTFAEDWKWCSNFIRYNFDIQYFPECVYVYRQRSGSITKNYSKKNLDDIIDVLDSALKDKDNIKDIRLKELFLSYYAFEYAYALGLFHRHLNEYRYNLQKISFFLKYNKSGKVRFVYYIKSIFGIRTTIFILHLYLIFKFKFIYQSIQK